MNNNHSGTIYGFDILKFAMAIAIVAIHTANGFSGYSWGYIVHPIIEVAVPSFFMLSSFFFFRKEERNIKPFARRIMILYLVWLVIDLPLVIKYNSYLDGNVACGVLYFIRDLLFSSTFSGSWFLSSLLWSIVLIHLLLKVKLPWWAIATTGLAVYSYFGTQEYWPDTFNVAYKWVEIYIREDVRLTLVSGIPWCILGYIFTLIVPRLQSVKDTGNLYLSIVIVALLLATEILLRDCILSHIVHIIFAMSLFVTFFLLNIGRSVLFYEMCKILRCCSVLIFLLHFNVLHLFNSLKTHNVEYADVSDVSVFFFVLSVTIALSVTIVLLCRTKRLHFLKYLY